ncbi:MAG: hypothetical protein RMJ97_07105 [Raineya sp.]|nr:hypothetical protein [Raineya sp.]MDW8296638.1 hypothetical protein [Raineya sp.]
MEKRNYISIVAFLLMFLWLTGTNVNPFFTTKSKFPTEHTQDSNQPQINTCEIKATLSGFTLADLQTHYFLLFEVPFVVLEIKFTLPTRPLFGISFFEKIFEHFIAPQAP